MDRRLFASNGENGATPFLPLGEEGARLRTKRADCPDGFLKEETIWQPMSR
jgi:hypothetical protein